MPETQQLEQQPDETAKKTVFESMASRLIIRRKVRHFNDRAARVGITAGGIGIIVTLLLIFLYLLYEVIPLFQSAEISQSAEFRLDEGVAERSLHLAIEEQAEIGMRLSESGVVTFFRLSDGETISREGIPLPDGQSITSFALDTEQSGVFALGLSSGGVLVAAHEYRTSYRQSDNAREIEPVVSYPFGADPFVLFDNAPLAKIAIRSRGDNLTVAGLTDTGALRVLRASQQSNLFAAFSDDAELNFDLELSTQEISVLDTQTLLLEGDNRWLIAVADNGLARILDLNKVIQGSFEDFEVEIFLTSNQNAATDIRYLLGGISLLVADLSGEVVQWFITRRDNQIELNRVRSFSGAASPVSALAVEQRRKNFISADTDGTIRIFNTTASRAVFDQKIVNDTPQRLAISPRGDALLVESDNGEFSVWDVHNEHPEVSWAALWEQVWYEGYAEPDYIWQSSAATNEFEPKYSLVPLSFGTLKAAFYAMLLAAPLAICGAIFTGYFMAPAMRRKVKPLIELMEALPTVVLGFLAGLWLAPFVENNLLGIFSMLILLPLSILLASLVWMFVPKQYRHAIPDGWEAAMLIPVIVLFGWLSFVFAAPVELLLFDGDLRAFITNDLGIAYDQRNAMVVGFAMGFAVIPTVFSIAEDAIFTVPRQLTYGSLALGATPWQSLYRVVLPTASPGIFSALMIGMGRAVGETMIVLMATGNTPIMDINIFEGMRTLAANIAVEVPESEVDSTHYRILFLAALVLFTFTFVINTIAEVIRQRLRARYSTI